MNKNANYSFQLFSPAEGDLFMEYLQKMALEGWMYESGENAFNLIKFSKAEPSKLYFQWECLPQNLKKKEIQKAEEEIIERHGQEGWDYIGTHGQMVLFSAKEPLPFEWPGGSWEKMERIVAAVRKMKKAMVFQSILISIIAFCFIADMWVVDVVKEDYLEWGLAGAFDMLEGNGLLILMVVFLFSAIMMLVFLVVALLDKIKEDEIKEILLSGKEVFYGDKDVYEKAKKVGKILIGVLYGAYAMFAVLFVIDIFCGGSISESFIDLFTFIGIYLGYYLISRKAKKRRWGVIKRILLYGLLFVVMVIFDVGLFFVSDYILGEKVDMDKAMAEATYGPELFDITDTSQMAVDYSFKKGLLGSVEYFDIYLTEYVEEDCFYYNYYRYEVKLDCMYRVLEKQAVENLELYDYESISNLRNGWSGYRIEWNPFFEQDIYTDTIVFMKDGEIILLNCNLAEFSVNEILEKILFSVQQV